MFGLAFVFYRWFRYGFAYSTTVIRHAELVSASILANFAVISFVCCNWLSVFCVVAGKEHSAAFNALHLTWSEVSSDDYVLAEKFIFCQVWAEAALNNAFCATTVIQSFDIKLVALWVCFYLCDFCNTELNVLVEVFYREKNNKNMGVPLRSFTTFGRSGSLLPLVFPMKGFLKLNRLKIQIQIMQFIFWKKI